MKIVWQTSSFYLDIYFLHGALTRERRDKEIFVLILKLGRAISESAISLEGIAAISGRTRTQVLPFRFNSRCSISYLSAVTAELLTRLAHTKLTKSAGPLDAWCW